MKVGLSGARLRLRRRFLRVTIILTGIVGLLAIYPLTGCASLGGDSDTRTTLAVTPIATATATGIAMATAKGQASPWKLVWSDEFNGPRGALPDPNKWSPQTGGGGWTQPPILDYDTENRNVYKDGQGHLVLEARKGDGVNYQCWHGLCQYSSARITTHTHFMST